MVYYRKYRPQTIEELDSKEVRDLLYSVLSPKDIAHAFLFTGPKGLGKTSAARIVAKVVNCEKRWDVGGRKIDMDVRSGKTRVKKDQKIPLQNPASNFPFPTSNIEPCNKCYQCISITNGSNIDVLEIDAASNRGIDEIRDLREKVRLSPASARKKVYIIDEVHMLTQEAFNALLKTLEEPPMHVIFILCTTEPHKVPATIVSRCFHIPFKKATIEELVRSFKRIASEEKLSIDNETLSSIASLSDGSFRDGVKILEEASLKADGKKITKSLIEERYQMSNIGTAKEKMIHFLGKRDTKQALLLVLQVLEYGVDIKYFLEQLISELHQMLLAEIGAIDSSKFIRSTSSGQSSKLSIEEIKELVELLARAYAELKYAVLPQLPLELAIIQWQAPINAEPHVEQRGINQRGSAYSSALFGDKTTQAKSQITDNEQLWQDLIDKVKSYNHSIAGVLRGCGLKSYDKDKIVIETGYKFHKERLEENNNLAILKKVCSEIAGNKIEVSVVLKIMRGGDKNV